MLNTSVQNKVLLSFLNVETQVMELEKQKLHTMFFSYIFLMLQSLLQWIKILFLSAESLVWNLVPLSAFHYAEYLKTDNFV